MQVIIHIYSVGITNQFLFYDGAAKPNDNTVKKSLCVLIGIYVIVLASFYISCKMLLSKSTTEAYHEKSEVEV